MERRGLKLIGNHEGRERETQEQCGGEALTTSGENRINRSGRAPTWCDQRSAHYKETRARGLQRGRGVGLGGKKVNEKAQPLCIRTRQQQIGGERSGG